MEVLEQEVFRYSDWELRELHRSLWEGIHVDEALARGGNLIHIRDFPDWRQQCRRVEIELRRRGLAFEPLPI